MSEATRQEVPDELLEPLQMEGAQLVAFGWRLSEAERRVVLAMRRLANDAGRRSSVMTILFNDGIWQLWEGKPAGTSK